MNVTLVHQTPDAEKLITEMARVSNPHNQRAHETAPRLLRYLVEHQHWSPFEMASMCVQIKTSRAISAQIIRHRSFSFQEYSQRYANVPAIEPIGVLRMQDRKNRQNSLPCSLPLHLQRALREEIEAHMAASSELYQRLCGMGVAREVARGVLPMNAETTLYMNGTLRSWIHYLQLRCAPETQLEHRQIAARIRDIFAGRFPVIAEAVGFPAIAKVAGFTS